MFAADGDIEVGMVGTGDEGVGDVVVVKFAVDEIGEKFGGVSEVVDVKSVELEVVAEEENDNTAKSHFEMLH